MEIDANGIKITAKPFKITADDSLNNIYTIQDSIIDKLFQALDKEKMMPGQENFNRMFSGIWEKENPTIKKEGNNMIESMNLIDLYANKHRESIEKETKEKIEKIRNESSIKKQYDEITQKCKDDLQKLYISQFTDEEIEKVKETLEGLSGYQKELQHKTSICEFGYFINSDFKNDEIKSLENEMINKINELNDLVKTVKAHVGIAKTKEIKSWR